MKSAVMSSSKAILNPSYAPPVILKQFKRTYHAKNMMHVIHQVRIRVLNREHNTEAMRRKTYTEDIGKWNRNLDEAIPIENWVSRELKGWSLLFFTVYRKRYLNNH